MDNKVKYCLRLADNSMILSHRLGEYSSNGPYLEEDLAITNVALDHLGQAEAIYKYVSELEGSGKTADDYAYKRAERSFYNFQLVELPNVDFARIVVRQFFIDTFNFFLYKALENCSDETIAAIAGKALKEITYHLRRSSEWMIRLGQGTEESRSRTQDAIDELWKFTGEFFEEDYDHSVMGIANGENIKSEWENRVRQILVTAGLEIPQLEYFASGSWNGIHTEYLGHLLSDMQYLQRAYPDAKW